MQVSLLKEHEVTRLITLVKEIAEKLDVDGCATQSYRNCKRTWRPSGCWMRWKRTSAASATADSYCGRSLGNSSGDPVEGEFKSRTIA